MTAFILYCHASRLHVLKGFTVCAHVSVCVWLSLCMCVCCVFWFECGCLHVITFCISVCVALPFRRKQLKLYHKLHIPIIRFLLFFLSFFWCRFPPSIIEDHLTDININMHCALMLQTYWRKNPQDIVKQCAVFSQYHWHIQLEVQ